MTGVRILCNQIIPVTDWNHDYVTIPSALESQSPLPTLTSFDLLNPLDNSGNGYTVTPRGGQIRDWGLHYDNGALPSLTNFAKAGHGAVSFITAFRLSSLSRYTNIINNRSAGKGFNVYYNSGLYLACIKPDGTVTKIISQGTVSVPEINKWYVASGVFDPVGKVASVRFDTLGLRYDNLDAWIPENTSLDTPLSIGGDPTGSTTSSMVGDIAFVAFYEGAFTATQRDEMVSVGREVLRERGLI